jgi:SAM-dependent methyltransferase
LDVGCGRGILLKDLADRGFETHGFEVSETAVKGIDPRVHVRIATDLKAAAYPPEFFDQIVIWHVLEHVSDPRTCISEMHRILKPGGELVVAVPNFSSPQARWTGPAWFHLDLPRHLYHFPIESLKQLLTTIGFAVVSEHHFSLRQNPFGWVQSVMNMLPALPRNGLYEMLHARGRAGGSRQSPFIQAIFWSCFFFGMPIALAVEIVNAVLRRGATVHVIAKRVRWKRRDLSHDASG